MSKKEQQAFKPKTRMVGIPLKTLAGHTAPVWGVAFSPDGKAIASASYDQTVRMWDAQSGKPIAKLPGHTASVNGVAFSPDGKAIASASFDQRVFVWRPAEPPVPFYAKDLLPEVRKYSNAKVVFVGDSGRGKTCLARALMGLPFEPQLSTHGMKVWHFLSESAGQENKDVLDREIFLWDLAGQPDYRVIHQLFLEQTTLALLLFDSSDPNNIYSGIEYWAKALRRVAGTNCKLLLVAGRVDRFPPPISKKDIKALKEKHGFIGYIETSANTGQGVDRLKQTITTTIPWADLSFTSAPELWQNIRAYLLKRRAGEEVLSRRSDLRMAFRQTQPDAFFRDEEFDTIIGHAQAQDLLWRLSFGDFVLLKPELLNDYASTIIREARKHPQGLGSVPERNILESRLNYENMVRIKDPATERSLLHAVLELCLEREVALREGEHIVFPSKFNRSLPEYPAPPKREVAYTFSGPVEDIYATLTVRLYYSGAFDLKDLYKDAAEFKSAGGKICGFRIETPHEGEGLLSIFFEAGTALDTKVLFLCFIHEHLFKKAIQKSLKRERIYRCPQCGEEMLNKRAIESRLQKGTRTYTCEYCDAAIPLFDLLEEKFGDPQLLQQVRQIEAEVEEKKDEAVGITTAKAKKDIGEFDVFLCHNDKDKPEVRALAEDLQKAGINPWLDEWEIRPGLPWQRVLEQQIKTIKSAAVVIGKSSIGPWMDMELNAFLREFVKREVPVIPVILSTVKKAPELPIFLGGMHYVDFRKAEPDPMQQLLFGITGVKPERGRFKD